VGRKLSQLQSEASGNKIRFEMYHQSEMIHKQDRQYTYNITLRRICISIAGVKKRNYYTF
jgi:hypothetical protein